MALADDRGDFSMRALGQKLRVDPMAIYRHFRDKEALLDAVVDEALRALEPGPATAGSPRERLEAICRAFRAALIAHPGIAARVSATRPTLGPHTVAVTEACLEQLHQLGLDPLAATRAFMTLIRFITGAAAAEEQLRARGSSEDTWREEMRAGYASLPADDYPRVASMVESFGRVGFREDFEYGLDLLIDAIARRGAAGT